MSGRIIRSWLVGFVVCSIFRPCGFGLHLMPFLGHRSDGAHVQWPTVVHNVDEAYSQLWEQIEADAARKCPFPLKSKMMGRARRTAPRKIRSQVVTPVKMARKGDFQPEYFGPSVKHAQWIRQARRLQAFSRMATNPSAALAIAKAEAWDHRCRSQP